ncbi:DUF4372 domain-containing protein [Prevotella communis]|uniref:DUF4372 domain-containing protein n=1 Tax=Prevotella communis TaxID=2913614 RepID=UPI003D69894E
MHIGTFVFAQIVQFLPQKQFRRILAKYNDRTKGWSMSHWNHLLVLMFGQLMGCGSLRELTDITTAHAKKSKHLGFGHQPINRQMLSKANALRDHHIFEEFAFYMVSIAQARLYRIHVFGAFFIIREKGKPAYEIVDGESILDGTDNVLKDQTIRFTKKDNQEKYPGVIRRIVYYAPRLHRSFVYYTNNFYLSAKGIALLYKYRWQVELFFKWIKQHLQVKRFWGESENAVRIQIHVAIISYCLIAIIEHDLKIGRSVFEVMRILGKSSLTMDRNRKHIFFSL